LKPDIPADQLERVQARVDQRVDALRRLTALLPPDADSALTFRPDLEEPAPEKPE
jgi:hypothetical protein